MEWRQEDPESFPDCDLDHSTVSEGGNMSPMLGCHSYQRWVEHILLSPCMLALEEECSEFHPDGGGREGESSAL